MDQQRLTTWTRSMRSLPSHRDVLCGPASAGLGLGILRLSDAVEAMYTKNGKKSKENWL